MSKQKKQWYMTKTKHGLILSDYELKIHRVTGAYTKRQHGFCKNVFLFADKPTIEFFATNVSQNIPFKVELDDVFIEKLSKVYDINITKEIRNNSEIKENLETVKELFGIDLLYLKDAKPDVGPDKG